MNHVKDERLQMVALRSLVAPKSGKDHIEI